MSAVLSFLTSVYTPFRWLACLLCNIGERKQGAQQQSNVGGSGGFRSLVNFGAVQTTEINIHGNQIMEETDNEEGKDEASA